MAWLIRSVLMTWCFQHTGWKIFRPVRAPWGEDTTQWFEQDWRWFRTYDWRNKQFVEIGK